MRHLLRTVACALAIPVIVSAQAWIGYTYPDPADYSALTWTDAFKAAHDKFSREYAFSDWKGIDWPGLYSRFLPSIVQAQTLPCPRPSERNWRAEGLGWRWRSWTIGG